MMENIRLRAGLAVQLSLTLCPNPRTAQRFAYRSEHDTRPLDHFHVQRAVCQKVGSVVRRIPGDKAVVRHSLDDDDQRLIQAGTG